MCSCCPLGSPTADFRGRQAGAWRTGLFVVADAQVPPPVQLGQQVLRQTQRVRLHTRRQAHAAAQSAHTRRRLGLAGLESRTFSAPGARRQPADGCSSQGARRQLQESKTAAAAACCKQYLDLRSLLFLCHSARRGDTVTASWQVAYECPMPLSLSSDTSCSMRRPTCAGAVVVAADAHAGAFAVLPERHADVQLLIREHKAAVQAERQRLRSRVGDAASRPEW